MMFVAAIHGAAEPEVPPEREPTALPAAPVPVNKTAQGPNVCTQPYCALVIIEFGTPAIAAVGVPGSITIPLYVFCTRITFEDVVSATWIGSSR